MKTILTLFLFVLMAFWVSAQSDPAIKNFVLVINGKHFHIGDTIPKSDFNNVEKKDLIMVDIRTNEKYQPLSYQWVVYIKDSRKDSSGIWMQSVSNPSTNPTPAYVEHPLSDLMKKCKSGDIVWFNEFKYAETTALLPKEFSFVVR